MHQGAPIETSDSETETTDGRPAMRGMIPLTQSKMHAAPTPGPAQPALPRRSALVIEILSFVLIAFLVVSALLFNFATPGRLTTAPSAVTVQLPPKPADPAVMPPAPGPVAQEDHPTAEAEPQSTAALPDVQPEAGSEATPQVEPPAEAAVLPPAATPQVEPPVEAAVLPPAATPQVEPPVEAAVLPPAATPQVEPPVEAAALPPAAIPQVEPPVEAAALPPAATPAPSDTANGATSKGAPEPAAAPAPVEATASVALPAEEAVALIRHGDQLLATGDIVAARSAYERAAAGGNRVAAIGVAKTYDPVFLLQAGVRGLKGDPQRAALWYGRAAAAGDREAQQRLRRLRAQFPQ
ncbi:MAG TPA: hypothetical protein VGZ72_18260 [Stellaceae bacterium]|nr:hypothetical protein [Stellaceae bacterium]